MVVLPEPFASIPRTQLLYAGPTPIQKLERLSAQYSATPTSQVSVWVKHEDTNSPLAGGGNKIRKLEYLVPDILASKCETLVTVGGVQSNHCRQVTALGAKLGLKVVTIQDDIVPGQGEAYYRMGNVQLSRMMGSTGQFGGEVDEILARLRQGGGRPYFIPSGASQHPLGGLGFARWAFELCEQEEVMGLFFDTIIVSVNSGSTIAGMMAGFKLADRQRKVSRSQQRRLICVDAASRTSCELLPVIVKIARDTATKIGLHADDIDERDVIIEDRSSSGMYGLPEKSTLEAMYTAASLEALILDPVYTGKAFTAVLDLLEAGKVRQDGNVLFCHTGGTAVLGAYGEI